MNTEIPSAASSAGATPPSAADHSADGRLECMGRWPHYWKWIWQDGVMTSRQHCSTCGTDRDTADGNGQ